MRTSFINGTWALLMFLFLAGTAFPALYVQ